MDNTAVVKKKRKPIFAIISIVLASIAILLIAFGLLCILGLSQIDNNWGMIIVGLIFLIVPALAISAVSVVLAIISFIRKEKLALSIIAISLCAPIAIFFIILLISGL